MDSDVYDRMYAIEEDLWWYRGRRSVCMALLERHLAGRVDARILDVGCGTGFNMKELARFGQVSGVDFADEALAYCRGRGLAEVRQGDAARLPYEDGAFDLVTAFDLIEHLDGDVVALQEFHRVTRPGGALLVYVPALPFLFSYHDRVAQHRRRYWKRQLTQRLQTAGYEVRACSHVNFFILPAITAINLALRLFPTRTHFEMKVPIAPVNRLLTRLSALEVPLILGRGLPLGSSLVALAVRPTESSPFPLVPPPRIV